MTSSIHNFKWTFGRELAIGITIALWLAIGSWPYIYYIFLRWGVFLVATYFGFRAYKQQYFGWVVCLALIAILFNPINPVYLDKTTWILIDAAASFFFLVVSRANFLAD